ncbi:hypothetical protein [uncultured Winogradskyella sp.]|uniref:hypothetical protein n=1 Tax=uncultured Winogradskyella sp. TaxID=395353 RepID=UPI002603943A|nr:hypothetical protein [uncultured Winogradskyella sp.]
MENRTEFNLNEKIEVWKSELSKKSNMTSDNIDELESHLLDLINDLENKGLNIEESFLIARKRIGRTDEICAEFDKINNFSFINTTIPYLKGALIYIAFIVLSKLFLVSTLLLSQFLNIDNGTFNILSVILLVIFSISFFSIIYFNLKKRESFLSKLSNAYVLVALITVSYIISVRLSAQVVLPGIDINKLGNPIAEFYTMELNFGIYKILCGIILLTTSLIIFWKNKKHNKLRYTE